MADLRCYDDLDPFGAECASPEEELEQDNYHRLITRPGGNLDDPEGGFGIREYLSGPFDPTMGPRMEAELRKDPRNAVVRVTITEVTENAFEGELEITTDDDELLSTTVTV